MHARFHLTNFNYIAYGSIAVQYMAVQQPAAATISGISDLTCIAHKYMGPVHASELL